METENFQRHCLRTMPNVSREEKLKNCTFGIIGELGECIDIIKKHLYQDHPLDKEKLEEELGDLLWYINNLASASNISIVNVQDKNVIKLNKRYPNGFNSEDSIRRVDIET